MDDRDIRLLQCYLGSVPTSVFDGILRKHMTTVFKGELEKKGISREYNVFYATGKAVCTSDGRQYDRNVAYVYTKDYRFSYRLAGYDDSGNEVYREVRLDPLDNELDYGVFDEIFGINASQIELADVEVKESLSTKERVYPPNPADYIVPEELRASHPPGTSGRDQGVFDFILKPAKLSFPGNKDEPNKVEFVSEEMARVGASFNSTAQQAIVSGKTVVFKDQIDAQRVISSMGKARLAKYASRFHGPHKGKTESGAKKSTDGWVQSGGGAKKYASRK